MNRTDTEKRCKEPLDDLASQLEGGRNETISMSIETRHSIRFLVELCYDMAEEDFSAEPRADHFFLDVLRVAEWLESQNVRTPRRAIPGPSPSTTSPRLETLTPRQATHGSRIGRLKTLRAKAEEIQSDASVDDSLYFSMRDVVDICTTEIDFLESADSVKI
jgi:hypothetical protein